MSRTTWDGLPISDEKPYGITAVVFRQAPGGPELLMLHRADRGGDYEGEWAWTPPAGARLPGEAVEDCARRELSEETGLVLELQPTACGTDDWPVYLAEAPTGAVVVLDAEHDRYEWLPPAAAIERCLPPAAREPLRAASRLVEASR